MKNIFIKHNLKYPLMEISDYLKLIYQNSFGPKHFAKDLTLDNIIKYLREEYENDLTGDNINIIEDIGNDYVRVSLKIIDKQKLKLENLAIAFYKSMDSKVIDYNNSKMLFNKQIELLIDMIKTGEIKLDKEKAISFIKEYLNNGIKPISHSKIYKKNYKPHYRVIHKKHLKELGIR
ncbi:MAG: hypothetical protein R6U15_03210 [Candidatus Izemoplasmatales bacterium]